MTVPHHRVVIVGTGFFGLGMAIRLAQRGEQDYGVPERTDEAGGTWRDNRYPGCACDIPSRLYRFSFDQKPDWTRDSPTAMACAARWLSARTCGPRSTTRRPCGGG